MLIPKEVQVNKHSIKLFTQQYFTIYSYFENELLASEPNRVSMLWYSWSNSSRMHTKGRLEVILH